MPAPETEVSTDPLSSPSPEGQRPASGRGARRPDIQGLRAIAVLMVIAFHAGLSVPGGFIGVDVFFVISGFVITAMLSREWATTGKIRFARFYIRRFKRLTPALALMVAVTMVGSGLILSPLGSQQNAAKTALGAIFLAANFVIARTTGGYFDAPAETNPLLNVWSLSVEEQFYLAFPAILTLGWLLSKKVRWFKDLNLVLVASVGVISFGLAVLTSTGWEPPRGAFLVSFYSPFTRAWEFALGGLLSLVVRRYKLYSHRLGPPMGLFGVVALVTSLFLIDESTPFPGVWTLIPVIGTLLLLLAGEDETHAISRAIGASWMVKIGDCSYSLYLWHWPFIVFASLIWPGSRLAVFAAVGLSIGPALASYRWVETPGRESKILGGTPLVKLVLITVTPPILFACALLFADRNFFWSPVVHEYQTAIQPSHTGRLAGCDTELSIGKRKRGECIFNPTASGLPIYLIGDSNADQFSEGIIRAAEELDRPVVLSTADACPFVKAFFTRGSSSSGVNEDCRTYVQETQEYLSASAPGLVVIASSDKYWSDADFAVGQDSRSVTTDPRAKLNAMKTGLTAVVRSLQSAGHTVMLVQATPKWIGESAWNPDRCSILTIVSGACTRRMSVEQAAGVQGPTRGILNEISSETGATVLDTWPLLCPDRVCATQTGSLIRYRDEGHLSVMQAQALAPAFKSAIAAAR